ncbi:RNA polymerase sigma factor [Streptomyces spororaveus]|uniref:RNA polymerase sigma factor n=1 Tax=Streptomyces spororaveus TaxID=284039 RepID=UPI00367CCB67
MAYREFRGSDLRQRAMRSGKGGDAFSAARAAGLRPGLLGFPSSPGELSPDTNVMAYLRQTARNLAVDEHRKEQRAGRRLVLLDMTSLDALPAGQDEEVDEELHRQRKWLHREISQMRDSQRRHVVALQSQGLSDVEIAAALGIPATRLHRLRNKAIAHLRRKLTGHIREGQRRKSLGRKDR